MMCRMALAAVVALLPATACADIFLNSSPITWIAIGGSNGSLYPSRASLGHSWLLTRPPNWDVSEIAALVAL